MFCPGRRHRYGRIILIGYHQIGSGLRQIDLQQWNYKAIDVVNGHVRRQDEKLAATEQGMKRLAQAYLTTEPLINVYPLKEIERAFQDLDQRRPGLFKAVLQPA